MPKAEDCEISRFNHSAKSSPKQLSSPALYGVTTNRFNEQVRRNRERFPEDFMFQLTPEELTSLRSQFATLKGGRGQHCKYLPYAFTEHGAILSAIRELMHPKVPAPKRRPIGFTADLE